MPRQWTDNQINAIEARGGSVIVSAAAGSGKTAVLVERVIRLITDPENGTDVDRLLVVTYTRAAAAELRQRLAAALTERIRETPADTYLIRQQTLLSKAHISTVDSFCAHLVKEYFYLLDIDRSFRIGDDGELSVLRADALRLTLDTMYAEGDPGFHALVENFASAKDDNRLEGNILRLFDFLRSHPFPRAWMEEKLSYYTDFTDASTSVWGRIIGEYTHEALDYLDTLYDKSLIAITMEPDAYAQVAALYQADSAFLARLRNAVKRERWDDIRAALLSFVPGRFVCRGFADNPHKLAAAAARDVFKAVVKELAALYAQEEAMCLYDIELLKGFAEQIFRAVSLFSEHYTALKRARGIADYPDLEHWALQLLVDEDTRSATPLAAEIAGRFDYIMVDEYQDANETQDTIFKALSRDETNLFVVGDVKQSIYGFRQAMPELFLERKKDAVLYRTADPVFPAKIILEKNFRSEAHVLSAVNYFFDKLMSPAVGDIAYNDEERLYPGAAYRPPAEPAIELDVIDKDGVGEADAAVAEARFIAERIHRMISEGYLIKDGEDYRRADYGDFAILMRSLSGYASIYAEVLERYGIRAHSESSAGFLGSREIMVMTNLLRVINNPALDIEMLSTVMSPIFAFSESDLARIRVGLPHGSLYAAITVDAQQGSEKSARFLTELAYYRGLSAAVSMSELINTIYERSSFLSLMCATDRTGCAGDNLRLLHEYARGFEQNTHRGLSAFISYLDRLTENGSDLPSAARANGTIENTVQIMTVHASKGLEFPVCFLANTARYFQSDAAKPVLLHPRYGYAQKRFDPALSASYNTMPRMALALEIARSEKSEELRILYVALTRARQKLILISTPQHGAAGYLAGVSRKLAGEREIAPFVVRSATSLSDWLAMCAMLHPDGAALREYAAMEVDYGTQADFDFACCVINTPYDEADADETDKIPDEPTGEEANTAVIEMLRRHVAYEYPYSGLLSLPVKVAASALAHRRSAVRYDRYLGQPAFMSNEALTSAEKGTALHEFMQFCNFSAARADIHAELDRLVGEGYLTRTQAESIDLERARAFVNSPLIDRCLRAQAVYKEYRFNVRVPASMIDPQVDEHFADESVILQGAVDLAFVENGGLVIVDYKTDRVRDPAELKDMYETQLMLYKEAMIRCLCLPVRECVIYSVRHSTEVPVYRQ